MQGGGNNRHSIGFTLAEVLITLVIIGVVAAMTVPAIIQQTQKQEYVSGLKKAYSVLQNSLYKIADNTGYSHGDYSYLNDVDFIDEFAKVTNIVKKCNSTSACFPANITALYKKLNGTSSSAVGDGKAVITSDGQLYTARKATTVRGLSEEDQENTLYRIIVDVNGWKKPNTYGYDAFVFYIVDGKGIVPAGSADTSNCNRSGNGTTCAAKVLRENKIDY